MNAPRQVPKLFNGPMVRALLGDLKLQTRRLATPGRGPNPSTRPAEPGDVLAVRESFRLPASVDHLSPLAVGDRATDAGWKAPWAPCWYEADAEYNCAIPRSSALGLEWGGPGRLRPGIHLPMWLVRIRLDVLWVRREPLQSITDEDALAEGVGAGVVGGSGSPRELFRQLWTEINGSAGSSSWDANPMVWVIGFRRTVG